MAAERPPTSATAAADVAARRAARLATPRLTRELKTIAAMLRIWCRDLHVGAARDSQQLCAECAELLDYARKRLAHCPYGADKPTCVHCPIHCYGKRQREAVREVMRHAGPRMLTRHPWLAIAHLIDGRRPPPLRPAVPAAVAGPPPQPAAEVTAATLPAPGGGAASPGAPSG